MKEAKTEIVIILKGNPSNEAGFEQQIRHFMEGTIRDLKEIGVIQGLRFEEYNINIIKKDK